jgi:hypothetical protein
MTTLHRWQAGCAATLAVAVLAGCSGTRSGRCGSCQDGAVYPPVGCYDVRETELLSPPPTSAPQPIPAPPGFDPAQPAPPPPPLSRVPAALQNIRYSTSDFFHNANENMRAMFTR